MVFIFISFAYYFFIRFFFFFGFHCFIIYSFYFLGEFFILFSYSSIFFIDFVITVLHCDCEYHNVFNTFHIGLSRITLYFNATPRKNCFIFIFLVILFFQVYLSCRKFNYLLFVGVLHTRVNRAVLTVHFNDVSFCLVRIFTLC